MSNTKVNTNTKNELVQLVTFKLGKEEFGVDIFKVREINKMMKITEVPNSPDFVEGIVNLRGNITPVIDLRSRLGLMQNGTTDKTSIIVVELASTAVGLIVDEVSEVLRISPDITELPPALVMGIDTDYITSVAKFEDRLLILLDIDRILNFTEIQKLAEVV